MNIPEEYLWKRPCPVCKSERNDVLIQNAYPKNVLNEKELARIYRSSSEVKLMDQLVQCRRCGCCYLSPCLRPEQIQEGYADAVDPVFVSQNPFRIRTFSRTLCRLRDAWHIAPGSRILDIGCAGGAFPKAAKDLGFNPTGIEPSRWMCEFARKEYGVDVRQGMLEEQDFGMERFDVVTLWDVLEHVANPGKTLERVFDLLRPGGLLILTYPDISGWPARLMGRNWPFLLSVHLTYYTRETIRRQVGDSGFEIKCIRPYWQTLSLGYAMERATLVAGAFAPLFRGMGKVIKAAHADSWAFSYYLSQSLAVAERP